MSAAETEFYTMNNQHKIDFKKNKVIDESAR